ncbi:MAG: hypothetical protein A4E27_01074 [Methanobacterium sp. PtaU1.Bin242]|nr:MAG: hypothetical protein A4E27_01074 [Methanobacterium sp. PtaU1.Bin242]
MAFGYAFFDISATLSALLTVGVTEVIATISGEYFCISFFMVSKSISTAGASMILTSTPPISRTAAMYAIPRGGATRPMNLYFDEL